MSGYSTKEQESVQRRIAEFLFRYDPFSTLSVQQVIELLGKSKLTYLSNGEVVFKAGESPHPYLYCVRKGQVDILGEDEALIDQCAEGELFGARALLENETYKAAAVVVKEALVIALPVRQIREIMAAEPAVMQFFFGDFSSGVALRKRRLAEIHRIKSDGSNQLLKEQAEVLEVPNKPITCSADTRISEAAEIMRKERVGSIIAVNAMYHPVGIVTDTDLRNHVATGSISTHEPIECIMSQPVYCVAAGKSVNDYVLDLTRHGVHHLCITENGQNNAPLLGVITDHDLLRARSNSAAVLLKSIKRAKDLNELKQLLQRLDRFIERQLAEDQSIRYLGNLMRLANELVLHHTFKWACTQLGYSVDSDSFCWLALGSVARKEQIIRTDFDAALVVKDEVIEQIPELIALNDVVYQQLTTLGFNEDPAGIQANNRKWVKTVNQWKSQFENWMQTPDEEAQLHATIFFDLMPLLGNTDLAKELQEFIQSRFAKKRSFEGFLALNALKNPPPLGFFKTFILEKSGEHKDEFDLKLRAMMPIADAARLLALKESTVYPSNTIARLERVSESIEYGREVVEDAAAAYEIFLSMRARSGFQEKNSGRYLNLKRLTNFEKQVLKNAFVPLRELQHLIKPV